MSKSKTINFGIGFVEIERIEVQSQQGRLREFEIESWDWEN